MKSLRMQSYDYFDYLNDGKEAGPRVSGTLDRELRSVEDKLKSIIAKSDLKQLDKPGTLDVDNLAQTLHCYRAGLARWDVLHTFLNHDVFLIYVRVQDDDQGPPTLIPRSLVTCRSECEPNFWLFIMPAPSAPSSLSHSNSSGSTSSTTACALSDDLYENHAASFYSEYQAAPAHTFTGPGQETWALQKFWRSGVTKVAFDRFPDNAECSRVVSRLLTADPASIVASYIPPAPKMHKYRHIPGFRASRARPVLINPWLTPEQSNRSHTLRFGRQHV